MDIDRTTAKRIIGYAIGVIFIIVVIMDFINTITHFKDLNDLTEQYGLHDFMVTLAVFELVFDFGMFIASIFTLYTINTEDNDYDETPTSACLSISLLLTLLLHITTDMAVGYANWLSKKTYPSSSYTTPAESVVMIVLTVIAFLTLTFSVIYNSNLSLKKAVGGVGIISLLAVYFVSFSNISSETEAFAVVINVLLFVGIALTGVFLLIPGLVSHYKKRTPSTNTNSNTSTPNNSAVINASSQVNKEDASKKLKELKELLDSGIITQEEFEGKRKKYIDQL